MNNNRILFYNCTFNIFLNDSDNSSSNSSSDNDSSSDEDRQQPMPKRRRVVIESSDDSDEEVVQLAAPPEPEVISTAGPAIEYIELSSDEEEEEELHVERPCIRTRTIHPEVLEEESSDGEVSGTEEESDYSDLSYVDNRNESDITVESVLSSSEASFSTESTEAETWIPSSDTEEESDEESDSGGFSSSDDELSSLDYLGNFREL